MGISAAVEVYGGVHLVRFGFNCLRPHFVQMIWSIDYLLRGLFRSRTAGRLAQLAFFWLRWLDRLVPHRFAVDSASGCYFLGTLSDQAITPREAVLRYRGAQKKSASAGQH